MKIKDIGKVVTGKTPSTKDLDNYGDGFMFISPSDLHCDWKILDSEKHITAKGFESISSNTITGLSILVGCIGWDMGNVAIVDGTCATNQQINAITEIKESVNPYYVYYWLKGRKEYLFTIANVTRTPILNKSDFENIEIQLPPRITQEGVAELLTTIDKKISMNNQICSELNSLSKLLYDYWFVQFDFPDKDGRPYKTSGGKMVWNDALKREIPEGWEVKYASDLTTVKTGKEDANFATKNGEFAYFTCGQEVLRCDTPAFEGRAILLAGNGDFNVKHYTGKFNAYQRTYVLIPDETKYYAMLYIATKEAVARLKSSSVGSIVKFITLSDVQGITLFDSGNDALLKKLNLIIDKIEQIESENQQLLKLRDFLLPMLMSGQVKVANK